MKKTIFIVSGILCLLFLTSVNVSGQYARASMWASDMSNFAAEDEVYGIPQDVVVFAGSSTFRMWSSLKTDFPDSRVLNRAFGGSWMTDLIYFFDQVVKPYAPSQVVLYEGDNDLLESGKSAESFMDDVITMTRLINIHYPYAKILLVSIKPSPSRSAYFTKYQAANALMKNYADKHDNISYVSTWEPMLNTDGSPNRSLYLSDMLHMNRAGYELWKEILEPYLEKSSIPIPETDKLIFTESSHANYHDYSFVNVTAPSVFSTVKPGKISTDSIFYQNEATSLRISYQGKSGGDWAACVSAPAWKIVDVSTAKELEFGVFAETQINAEDMPYLYLESGTNKASGKIALSDYINEIPAGKWTKVQIPVTAWMNVDPDFTYETVKSVFFSQKNENSTLVSFYVDDVIFRIEKNDAVGTADVFVNFGATPTGSNWNNVTDHQTAVVELKDKNGLRTDITLKVTDPFYNGFNFNGTESPAGAAAEFLPTATKDNFFGHGNKWGNNPPNPVGEIELTGVNSDYTYSFSFFGSRMGSADNRETLFTVTGDGNAKSDAINTSGNADQVAVIANVKPTADGKITIRVEAGSNNNNSEKFFYLAVMKMMIHTPTGTAEVKSKNSIAPYYTGGAIYIDEYTGSISLYDVSGKRINNGQAVAGYYPATLSNGVYIIQTTEDNYKLLVDK